MKVNIVQIIAAILNAVLSLWSVNTVSKCDFFLNSSMAMIIKAFSLFRKCTESQTG